MIREIFSRRWILLTFLVVLAAVVCVRLGIWQLDRLAQRRAANAHYIEMSSSMPVTLPSSESLTPMEYRSIIATGRYDFSQQVAIRNQYLGDQYGYHLLTPLVLDDGQAIFVDRGWIPAEGNAQPGDWKKYDVVGQVTVKGIIRLPREKADFTGRTDPPLATGQTRLDIWTFPNLKRLQIQTSYPLYPVYLQQDPEPARTDPPVPSQPEVDLTEGPHLSYAIQWFSFAAIFLIGYPFYIRRQLVRDTSRTVVEEGEK
jgi:surfeit locus 1 family protein